MIRALCLVGGLTGAAGLSQAPEFSQQYLQRLAGQVDALTQVVVAFDQTALADGLGREEMLQAMEATPLVASQATMWRATFARHARLSDHLTVLREATPLERLTMPHRMLDAETVRAAWADFTPAVPLSAAGLAAAGGGFVGGWAIFGLLATALAWPLRRQGRSTARQPQRRAPAIKKDPPVMRPRLVASQPDNKPRLAGVRR